MISLDDKFHDRNYFVQDVVKYDKLNTKKENTYITLNVAKDLADPFQQLTKFIVNGSLHHVIKINTKLK